MTHHPRAPLTAEALGDDPIAAFGRWLAEAEAHSGLVYANAVCLSTVDPTGWPEGRIVLLKGADARGFTFFTNYRSAKGRSLEATPRAALTFFWDPLGRQVRVRGEVARTAEEESDEYFRTRPYGSRVGAWASEQSEPIEDRERLEARAAEVRRRYDGVEVPRPPHWGGFLLKPREVEFWQEGAHRLHDRFRFRRDAGGGWEVMRLNP